MQKVCGCPEFDFVKEQKFRPSVAGSSKSWRQKEGMRGKKEAGAGQGSPYRPEKSLGLPPDATRDPVFWSKQLYNQRRIRVGAKVLGLNGRGDGGPFMDRGGGAQRGLAWGMAALGERGRRRRVLCGSHWRCPLGILVRN